MTRPLWPPPTMMASYRAGHRLYRFLKCHHRERRQRHRDAVRPVVLGHGPRRDQPPLPMLLPPNNSESVFRISW